MRVPTSGLPLNDDLTSWWEGIGPNPRIGVGMWVRGARVHPVSFFWQQGDDSIDVMVHINSLTDRHRVDVTPAILERVPGTDIRHITYLLPSTLTASYRFVSLKNLAADVGTTRSGWLEVHARGLADPRGGERIANPLGDESSVLEMPDAPKHPVWCSPATRASVFGQHLISATQMSPERTIWLYQPTGCRPDNLVIVFDGDTWANGLRIQSALDAWAGPTPAVVLVSSIDSITRTTQLPDPLIMGEVLAKEILPTVTELLGRRFDAAHTIVCGQSFGGLAAAGLAVTRPDLVGVALVQSGSFHFRAGAELDRTSQAPGALTESLRGATFGDQAGADAVHERFGAAHVVPRIVLQVGLEEGILVPQAQQFAHAAAEAGACVSYKEFSGGHDYAWWRHGFFWGLEEILGPRACTSSDQSTTSVQAVAQLRDE